MLQVDENIGGRQDQKNHSLRTKMLAGGLLMVVGCFAVGYFSATTTTTAITTTANTRVSPPNILRASINGNTRVEASLSASTNDPLLPLPLPPPPTTTIVVPLEDSSSSSSSGRRPRFSRVCQGSHLYERTKDYCFMTKEQRGKYPTRCWSPWDVFPVGNWISGVPDHGELCGPLCTHQAGIYSPVYDYCYQSIDNPAMYFWTSDPIDCTQSHCRATYPHNIHDCGSYYAWDSLNVVGACGNGDYGTGSCANPQECCSAAADYPIDGTYSTSTFGECGVGPKYCGPCGNGSIGNGFCADPTHCCNSIGYCESADHPQCTLQPGYTNDNDGPFYCTCDPNRDYVCVAQQEDPNGDDKIRL